MRETFHCNLPKSTLLHFSWFSPSSASLSSKYLCYLPSAKQCTKNGPFIISFNPKYSPERVGIDIISLLTFHRCSVTHPVRGGPLFLMPEAVPAPTLQKATATELTSVLLFTLLSHIQLIFYILVGFLLLDESFNGFLM